MEIDARFAVGDAMSGNLSAKSHSFGHEQFLMSLARDGCVWLDVTRSESLGHSSPQGARDESLLAIPQAKFRSNRCAVSKFASILRGRIPVRDPPVALSKMDRNNEDAVRRRVPGQSQ